MIFEIFSIVKLTVGFLTTHDFRIFSNNHRIFSLFFSPISSSGNRVFTKHLTFTTDLQKDSVQSTETQFYCFVCFIFFTVSLSPLSLETVHLMTSNCQSTPSSHQSLVHRFPSSVHYQPPASPQLRANKTDFSSFFSFLV